MVYCTAQDTVIQFYASHAHDILIESLDQNILSYHLVFFNETLADTSQICFNGYEQRFEIKTGYER